MVKRIHTDNIVVLKIEKEVWEIPQEVGVQQGNNMAPVLFLFLMTAFAETLRMEWKRENIKVVTVMTASDDLIQHGQLCSHTPKMFRSKFLSACEIFQCLYVDNGAFLLDTQDSLSKGMNLVFKHFMHFGLEMHIGRNGGESKTECVFYPPPQFFQQRQTLTIKGPTRRQTRCMTRRESTDTPQSFPLDMALPDDNDENDKEPKEQKGVIYDKLDKTNDIEVADGYVTFTRSFRYLGSMVAYNLCDDDDVTVWIAAAKASMGALKEVWWNKHLNTYSKYLLFCAIPMNTCSPRSKSLSLNIE